MFHPDVNAECKKMVTFSKTKNFSNWLGSIWMLNSILYLLFIELLKNGKGVAQRFELWSSLGEFRNELYKLILVASPNFLKN